MLGLITSASLLHNVAILLEKLFYQITKIIDVLEEN